MAAVSCMPEDSQLEIIAGPMTLVRGPMSNTDVPTSRTLAIKSSTQAAIKPGRSNGMVTVQSWYSHEAPHTRAHSSTLLSSWTITPEIVRTPRGRNTVRYPNNRSQIVP